MLIKEAPTHVFAFISALSPTYVAENAEELKQIVMPSPEVPFLLGVSNIP